MAPPKRGVRRKLISSSRPPVKTSTQSSRLTRSTIRTHHVLQKQLQQAVAANNDKLADSLRARVQVNGGLDAYQKASIQGQSKDRGGDSSHVLVDWLREYGLLESGAPQKSRMLEVGSLSPFNACSKSGFFEMERIDLQSQHQLIKQQDFMERPIPADLEAEGFDVVSLSLVLNYVGDPSGRGQMLKRVSSFLRTSLRTQSGSSTPTVFPGLFLVLPAPCLVNSRYITEERLCDMMESLGYTQLKRKETNKLVYSYWKFHGPKTSSKSFPKQILRQGPKRNNFSVIL